MCWALPSAGDSVDYKWVLNYLLCTVFPLPQQKTWASNAFPGKAVQTQWPLKVSFCALPEPVAEVWHLASLQASTRISTESSRMWTKPEMLLLLLVLGLLLVERLHFLKAHSAILQGGEGSSSCYHMAWMTLARRVISQLYEVIPVYPCSHLSLPGSLMIFGDSIMTDIWYSMGKQFPCPQSRIKIFVKTTERGTLKNVSVDYLGKCRLIKLTHKEK